MPLNFVFESKPHSQRHLTSSLEIQRGFSLIELLTVIAVVAILAGLLLPALASSRRRASTTQCQSQIRQCALALELYCNDSRDVLPPNRDGQDLPLGETWVRGWLGLPGPDCTNLIYLRECLLGPYLPAVSVWRCPSSRPVTVGRLTQMRVRNYSINGFLGSPVTTTVATIFRKRSDFNIPSPSDLLTFVEERADTINDGTFAMQWDFDDAKPDLWVLRDQPAMLHGRIGGLGFADGHVESHRWLDFLEAVHNRNDQPAPRNRDVKWLQQHATWRKADRTTPKQGP